MKTNMKTKTYSFYADTGHGWLKVSRMELIKLGIQVKFREFTTETKRSKIRSYDCFVP